MSCQQVAFTEGSCLVEIERSQDALEPKFTAHLSVVEDDGAIVRPLVFGDGRLVEVHATNEPLALASAISYLEHRFGALSEPEHACSLGAATIGRPFVIEPA
jgi:hypothetical protein